MFAAIFTYRITNAMTQVHARISEADTSERRCKPAEYQRRRILRRNWDSQHLSHSFMVVSVLSNSWEVLDSRLKRPERENISDRIAALIGRTENGIGRAGYPFIVTDRYSARI